MNDWIAIVVGVVIALAVVVLMLVLMPSGGNPYDYDD